MDDFERFELLLVRPELISVFFVLLLRVIGGGGGRIFWNCNSLFACNGGTERVLFSSVSILLGEGSGLFDIGGGGKGLFKSEADLPLAD